MLIVTIPGPQNTTQLEKISRSLLVDACRFNTGVRVPYSPLETLERLMDMVGSNLWIDLKGRQLRITQWADPLYGRILLNHEVEIELPAHVHFRGDDVCDITAVNQNQIFVSPNPRYALGDGQAVNIHGRNVTVKGYLTDEDILYIEAAKTLGLNQFMLSFVEGSEDVLAVEQYCPDAEMYLKIESPKGLDFVKNEYDPNKSNIHLMAARDDLSVNLSNKMDVILALKLIIGKDPKAIVASKLLTSLIRTTDVELGDISDLFLMNQFGFQNFMFCDSISSNLGVFQQAMSIWKEFQIRKNKE